MLSPVNLEKFLSLDSTKRVNFFKALPYLFSPYKRCLSEKKENYRNFSLSLFTFLVFSVLKIFRVTRNPCTLAEENQPTLEID